MRNWLLCCLFMALSCDVFLEQNPDYCDANSACTVPGTYCELSRHHCAIHPVVTGVSPAAALSTGGTVRLSGQGFSAGLSVIVNGDLAAPLAATVLSDSELEFTLPPRPGVCALFPITVRTAGGELAASQAMLRIKYGNLSLSQRPLSMPISGVRLLYGAKINGDDLLDLVLSYTSGQALSVGFGDGRFDFALPGTRTGQNDANYSSLQIADIDGDTKTDLVGANSSLMDIYQGNGNGLFGATTRLSISNSAINLAEVNGSAGLELIVINGITNEVRVHPFTAGAFFSNANAISVGTINSTGSGAVVADFIPGGGNDIVAAAGPSGRLYNFQQVAGAFQAGKVYSQSGEAALLTTFDVNGDGLQDLIVALQAAEPNGQLLLGLNKQGDFTFTPIASIAANPTQIFLEDFDCDGMKDIILAHANAPHLQVYANTGSGGFSATSTQVSTGRVVSSIVVGQLDSVQDNKVDIAGLAGATMLSPQVAVFQNVSN